MMPRSAVPSHTQVNMLIETLEERRWLATGHARTAHARDRTRAAWQEVAVKLNSDGSGCIKTWQQWAKYWKDKKSAVRKKASQIRMARQRTGGGPLEEACLNAIEEKIVTIMGGEGFFTGDRELEIDFLHTFGNRPGPSVNLTPEMPIAISEPSDAVLLSIQGVHTEEASCVTPESESILQSHGYPMEHATAGMLQSEQSTPTIPDVQPGPSWRRDNMPSDNQHNTQEMFEPRSPPAVPPRNNASIASSSPRRRRMVTSRRRLITRSPPHKGSHKWRV